MAPSPGGGGLGTFEPWDLFPGFPQEPGLKLSSRRGAGSHQHPATGESGETQGSAWVRGCIPT